MSCREIGHFSVLLKCLFSLVSTYIANSEIYNIDDERQIFTFYLNFKFSNFDVTSSSCSSSMNSVHIPVELKRRKKRKNDQWRLVVGSTRNKTMLNG